MLRAFRDKTTGSHVVLREHNSGAKNDRELSKGLKNLASLVVCTRKKSFGWGCRFFVSVIISGGLLGHLVPLHLALDPNC